jgi:NADPH:quinone reductase-like Zn-dependent oxidoreductase
MQTLLINEPGGLDALAHVTGDPRPPEAGEVQVRVHASSLNFHDYLVAAGLLPTEKPRVPMSDAAGEVTAVGEGVTAHAVGDRVMSHFFPNWDDGEPSMEKLLGVPGDHCDGFASQTGHDAGDGVLAHAGAHELCAGGHAALRGPDRLERRCRQAAAFTKTTGCWYRAVAV